MARQSLQNRPELRGEHEPPRDWRERVRTSRLGTMGVLTLTAALVVLGAYFLRPDAPIAAKAGNEGSVESVELTAAASGPAPEVGQAAPGFTGVSIDGKKVSLAQLKGKPVWLTFGASWCSACRVEAPDIQAAHAEGEPKDLAIVAFYLSEEAMTVKTFAQRLGLTFDQVPDPETQVASSYRVMGIPAHFFIDRDGVLRSTHVGILSEEKIATALKEIS